MRNVCISRNECLDWSGRQDSVTGSRLLSGLATPPRAVALRLFESLVGETGFEPATSCSQSRRPTTGLLPELCYSTKKTCAWIVSSTQLYTLGIPNSDLRGS